MAVKILPPPFKKTHDNNAFVESVLKLYEGERTTILSENFKSLFNLTKLEEKPTAILWQALVFTVGDPPVFLAFTPTDPRGQTEKHLSLQEIKTYVTKLVRSLTSAIHTFSEESIAIATVIVDSKDLSNLREKIAEAKSKLPASRRGMTAAVYDRLMVAVTAALGLGAYRAGCSEQDKGSLVIDLKSNKGRVRRPFSMLGYVILHLENMQSPKISSSLTPSILFRTLDLTKPTLVICNDRSKELEEMLRQFKWKVATRPTKRPGLRNVIVVDPEGEKGIGMGNVPKGVTTIWISSRDKALSSTRLPSASCAMPLPLCNSSRTSEQRENTTVQACLPTKRSRMDESDIEERPRKGIDDRLPPRRNLVPRDIYPHETCVQSQESEASNQLKISIDPHEPGVQSQESEASNQLKIRPIPVSLTAILDLLRSLLLMTASAPDSATEFTKLLLTVNRPYPDSDRVLMIETGYSRGKISRIIFMDKMSSSNLLTTERSSLNRTLQESWKLWPEVMYTKSCWLPRLRITKAVQAESRSLNIRVPKLERHLPPRTFPLDKESSHLPLEFPRHVTLPPEMRAFPSFNERVQKYAAWNRQLLSKIRRQEEELQAYCNRMRLILRSRAHPEISHEEVPAFLQMTRGVPSIELPRPEREAPLEDNRRRGDHSPQAPNPHPVPTDLAQQEQQNRDQGRRGRNGTQNRSLWRGGG